MNTLIIFSILKKKIINRCIDFIISLINYMMEDKEFCNCMIYECMHAEMETNKNTISSEYIDYGSCTGISENNVSLLMENVLHCILYIHVHVMILYVLYRTIRISERNKDLILIRLYIHIYASLF